MKTLLRVAAAAGLVALTGLAVTPIFAQDGPPPGPPPERRMGPGGPGGPGFGRGPGGPMGILGELGPELRELDLTDAQREQVRGVVAIEPDRVQGRSATGCAPPMKAWKR